MLTLFRLVYSMNTIASKHQLIRKLDLGSLELFVQICQSGSLAAVSANAHLAISSISKRIKELETLLATPLLIRKARGVEPTEAGLCLLKHAKTVVLSVEQLRVDLQDFSLGRNEYVRIFASASVVEQYLAAEIAEFAKKFPDISIDLAQLSSREVIQAVQEGQADIGICDVSKKTLGLDFKTYRTDALMLITPFKHPLAKKRTIAFIDTLDYEYIGIQGSSMIQQLLENSAKEHGLVLRQRIKVSSLSALCRMVESGLGIGVIPSGAMHLIAKSGSYKCVRLTDPWARRELMLFSKSFASLSVGAKTFSSHLIA